MNTMNLLRPTLVILAIAITLGAFAQDDEHADEPSTVLLDGSPQSHLLLALSAIHEPPSLAALEATGLELPDALYEVADNTELTQVARGRAIDAIAFFPSEAAWNYVERFLLDPSQDNLYLTGRAVRLVGDRLSLSDPERALAVLAPFSAHPDAAIRMHLVQTLALMRTRNLSYLPEVDDALLQIVFAERNQAVVQTLEEALGGAHVIRTLQPRSLQRSVQPVQP